MRVSTIKCLNCKEKVYYPFFDLPYWECPNGHNSNTEKDETMIESEIIKMEEND